MLADDSGWITLVLGTGRDRTSRGVSWHGPVEFEQLLLQGQCTIEDKTTRTGETTHLRPLLSVRPQFKPISLQTNLDPPLFAFCSPHPASLTQLDSTLASIFNFWRFNFCDVLKASSIHVIALSIPGINAEAFRAALVNTWVSIEINSKNGWTALWNGRPPRSNARRPFLRRPANWQSLSGSV
jgi:hypothetical protein